MEKNERDVDWDSFGEINDHPRLNPVLGEWELTINYKCVTFFRFRRCLQTQKWQTRRQKTSEDNVIELSVDNRKYWQLCGVHFHSQPEERIEH